MPDHRVTEEWMGTEVETLEDLLRPNLRALCVGINPSPVSVQAGHYYQGKLGRAFFSRLIRAGVVPSNSSNFMDDVAFRNGVGFTDIVKRPTKAAKDLTAAELGHGEGILRKKIEDNRPRLVIFTFKATAVKLLGRFEGNGFIGAEVGGAEVFVMPGPYESASTVSETLDQLRQSFAP